jgi:hypothetical protein
MSLDSSLLLFAYDLREEGIEAVLDNTLGRAGVSSVTMAATYHDGRDIFPHATSRRVRYLEPGVTFFLPDLERYRGLAIQPRPAAITVDGDPLRELVAAADRRGARVGAWTVFMHHDRIGDYVQFAPQSAYGDPVQTDFCPSQPEVRAYATALAADVAGRGVSHILAEAVHFHPLEHGLHHERYFLALKPRTRFLLGLCFCEACESRARVEGVDVLRLRRWVAAEVTAAFDGHATPSADDLFEDETRQLAGGELGAYLDVRERTVTSLTAELREVAASSGVTLAYLEPSGAVKGYADGRPTGPEAVSIAWRFGIDVPALAEATDELEVMAYAAAGDRVDLDLRSYASQLGGNANLSMALRPTEPDCDSVENLVSKLRLARRHGVRRVDFYHYGLMRLDALDRIAAAFAVAGDQSTGVDNAGGEV